MSKAPDKFERRKLPSKEEKQARKALRRQTPEWPWRSMRKLQTPLPRTASV
jgi:hypothetical protein